MGSRENLLLGLAIICVMALSALGFVMTKNSQLSQQLVETSASTEDTSVNPAADDSDSLAMTSSTPNISIFPLDADKTKVELQHKTDGYSLTYTNDHYFLMEAAEVLVFAPPFNKGALLKVKTVKELGAPSDVSNSSNCTKESTKIGKEIATKYACEGQIWTYYQLSHGQKYYQLDLSDSDSAAAKSLLSSFVFLD